MDQVMKQQHRKTTENWTVQCQFKIGNNNWKSVLRGLSCDSWTCNFYEIRTVQHSLSLDSASYINSDFFNKSLHKFRFFSINHSNGITQPCTMCDCKNQLTTVKDQFRIYNSRNISLYITHSSIKV